MIALDDDRHYNCQELARTLGPATCAFLKKAAENRERILKAASRLMREHGISGAGVDALTERLG
jgi:AcrR family transcriptional regulator